MFYKVEFYSSRQHWDNWHPVLVLFPLLKWFCQIQIFVRFLKSWANLNRLSPIFGRSQPTLKRMSIYFHFAAKAEKWRHMSLRYSGDAKGSNETENRSRKWSVSISDQKNPAENYLMQKTFLLCLALDVTTNCIFEIHCIALDRFDLNTVHTLSNSEKRKISAKQGFKPRAAGWEARKFPLWYEAPLWCKKTLTTAFRKS